MTSDRGHRFDRNPGAAQGRAMVLQRKPLGRVDTVVGLTMIESMMMTPGAQENEMSRINNDMNSFNAELAVAAQAHGEHRPIIRGPADVADYAKAVAAEPSGVAVDPIVALYRTAWLPLWQTWTAFFEANKTGAWFSNPVSEAEKYQDQLIDIRAKAQSLGVKLSSPGPRQEHPEGLPSWLLPVGVGVGALVVLSILARSN